MIGETIGNYRITGMLGQGGMGTVYQAEDSLLGRKVAIKLLNPSLVSLGSTELERFKAEAKVQANLNNPNIVTLHDFQAYGDSFYMVMEYVEGKSLSDLVRTNGSFPPHIVVILARQILEGLSSAHAIGVVHRDLKPSNIMLTAAGVAKVMDFGIAKAQGGKNLTATGALVGTVLYMSPEQVRGEVVDSRSDLYSLGIILFELLTGRVPFKEESDFSIMIHHVQTPPPPPTQLLPEIPTALEDIVLRCLEKTPDQRYQSAEEILAALDTFEEQERALGRGQLYTRRMLVQWLAQPATPDIPAAASALPAAIGPPPTASTSTPVLVPSTATTGSEEPSRPEPASARAGTPGSLTTFIWVAVALLALAAALTAYYYTNRGEIPSWLANAFRPTQPQAAQTPPESSPAPVHPEPAAAPPAEPASSSGAPISGSAPELGNPPAAPAALSGSPAHPTPVAPAQNNLRQADSSVKATPEAPSALRPASAPKSAAGPRGPSLAARPTTAQDGAPTRAANETASRGFLIFLDPDQASERLPLAGAQAQIADIVQERGFQVLSSGLIGRSVRAAIDSGDLAAVRKRGIGYIVMGIANGSLASQTAYGSTYHVASVSVNFEIIRTADGKIAGTGRSTAKSRGSANPDSALSEALLSATSEGAREMMRQFQP